MRSSPGRVAGKLGDRPFKGVPPPRAPRRGNTTSLGPPRLLHGRTFRKGLKSASSGRQHIKKMCPRARVRSVGRGGALCPFSSRVIVILGVQEEPRVNGTQGNERHLVKQSQLPDTQSPCLPGRREEAAGSEPLRAGLRAGPGPELRSEGGPSGASVLRAIPSPRGGGVGGRGWEGEGGEEGWRRAETPVGQLGKRCDAWPSSTPARVGGCPELGHPLGGSPGNPVAAWVMLP